MYLKVEGDLKTIVDDQLHVIDMNQLTYSSLKLLFSYLT